MEKQVKKREREKYLMEGSRRKSLLPEQTEKAESRLKIKSCGEDNTT